MTDHPEPTKAEVTNVTFAATLTEIQTDTRTFSGVAIQYDELTSDARDPKIRFAPGSFGNKAVQGELPLVSLFVEHDKGRIRVGRVESWLDSEAALTFTASINTTPEGDEIYEALKRGELDSVSLGVIPTEFSEESDGSLTYRYVELDHLAIVGSGAFAGSKILSVFSETNDEQVTATSVPTNKETPHMEELNTEVADLRADVDELNRSVSLFAEQRPSAPTVSKFASIGEVIKAISAGDETAKAEYEEFAYTGGVKSQTEIQHAWAAPLIKVVDLGRPMTSLFNKLPDPGSTTIDYLKLNTNTISVAEQVAEGDDLAYGKVSLTSATASMKTFGGWFDWSQQALDRSDVGVVDLGYRALAAKYAEVTETVVRTTFLAGAGTSVTGFDAADYGKVIDTVISAQTLFTNRGEEIGFIVASPDVFRKLAKANTGTANDFVLNRSNGDVNVRGISATLFGIPVKVLPSGTNVFTFTNSSALTVWESGVGRLQDSNIINLTSQFSLYGYLGVAVTNENAIVKAVA